MAVKVAGLIARFSAARAGRGAISTEKAGWILLGIVIVGAVYAGLRDEINSVLARVAEEFAKIVSAGGS